MALSLLPSAHPSLLLRRSCVGLHDEAGMLINPKSMDLLPDILSEHFHLIVIVFTQERKITVLENKYALIVTLN